MVLVIYKKRTPLFMRKSLYSTLVQYHYAGFPRILENLENNKFVFYVLEMSLNLTKSGNILEIVLPVKNIHLEQKAHE